MFRFHNSVTIRKVTILVTEDILLRTQLLFSVERAISTALKNNSFLRPDTWDDESFDPLIVSSNELIRNLKIEVRELKCLSRHLWYLRRISFSVTNASRDQMIQRDSLRLPMKEVPAEMFASRSLPRRSRSERCQEAQPRAIEKQCVIWIFMEKKTIVGKKISSTQRRPWSTW